MHSQKILFFVGLAFVGSLVTFIGIYCSKNKQGVVLPYLEIQLLKTKNTVDTEVVIRNIVFSLDTGTNLPSNDIIAGAGQIGSRILNIDTQGQVANSINGMSYSVNSDCILTIFGRPKTKKTKYAVVNLYANKSNTSKSDIKYHND